MEQPVLTAYTESIPPQSLAGSADGLVAELIAAVVVAAAADCCRKT